MYNATTISSSYPSPSNHSVYTTLSNNSYSTNSNGSSNYTVTSNTTTNTNVSINNNNGPYVQMMTSSPNPMDFYIQDVNFSLHTKASPECELQLYRLTNPMEAQISILNSNPIHHQQTPPQHFSTTVYALQIHLEKYQSNQWLPCTANSNEGTNIFKDYEAQVIMNQNSQQNIAQLIQTDGKSLYIQVPLHLGFYFNHLTSLTFRSKLNTSKEKQGYKRGENAIFRVVFSLLKQQNQLYTYIQNKYESIPFGIINHGKNSNAVQQYKDVKLSTIPGTAEYLKVQQAMLQQNGGINASNSISTSPLPLHNNNSSQHNIIHHQQHGSQTNNNIVNNNISGQGITTPTDLLNSVQGLSQQDLVEMLSYLIQEQANMQNVPRVNENEMYLENEDVFQELNNMEQYFTSSSEEDNSFFSTNSPTIDKRRVSDDLFYDEEDGEDLCGASSHVVAAKESSKVMDSLYPTEDLFGLSPSHTTLKRSSNNNTNNNLLQQNLISFNSAPPMAPSMKQSWSDNVSTTSSTSFNTTTYYSSAPQNNYSNSSMSRSRSSATSGSLQPLSTTQSYEPPKMTFGQQYIQVTKQKEEQKEEKKKRGLKKLFHKKKEKDSEEKTVRKDTSTATFLKNFKPALPTKPPTNFVQLSNTGISNNREIANVTQIQSVDSERDPTMEGILLNLEGLSIDDNKKNGTTTPVKTTTQSNNTSPIMVNNKPVLPVVPIPGFDISKIIFKISRQGDPLLRIAGETIPKGSKLVPTFHPGDIIQFSVINRNTNFSKTSIAVGITIPGNRAIVSFTDSEGFSSMKDSTMISKTVQIPTNIQTPKTFLIVLFLKVVDSNGKERKFTNKRKIVVVKK